MNPAAILRERGVTRTQAALLVALAVDNVGSGLFLPLALVYATRVVGLPVDQAGLTVSIGIALGLLVPPVAARLNHRLGPRPVVVMSQLVQLAGTLAYLLASAAPAVLVGAALLSIGTQLFYCSVFVLVAEVTRSEAKERPFALVAMVRSGAFGLGALIAAVALSAGSEAALRWLVAADAVTYVAAAALLWAVVDVPSVEHQEVTPANVRTVVRDHRYLMLMGAALLIGLGTDVALVGMPIYVLDVLHGPTWLPGALLAVGTVVSSLVGVQVVDALRSYRRTAVMQAGARLMLGWSMLTLSMVWLPGGLTLAAYSVAVWMVWVAANRFFYPVTAALSEALPPRSGRGGYMAIYQYSFTAAQAVAPAVVALFAVSDTLPWIVVGASAALAMVAVSALARRLPAELDLR